MDNFLDTYDLTKCNQGDISNKQLCSSELKALIR